MRASAGPRERARSFSRRATTRRRRSIHPAGGALVVGGVGALGAKTAEWLSRRRDAAILTGRTGRGSARGTLRSLVDVSAVVVATRSDASTAEGAEAAIRAVAATFATPGFAARARANATTPLLAAQTAAGVRGVFAPKLNGATRLLSSLGVAAGATGAFAAFTSVAGSSDPRANQLRPRAAADAAAGRAPPRRAFSSVQWGAWSGGMADAGVLRRAIRMGLGAVSPEAGLEALGRIVAAASRFDPAASRVHVPTSAVSPFDWTAFLATYPARPAPPFFDDVVVAEGNERSNAIAGAGASRRDGATAAAERVAAIVRRPTRRRCRVRRRAHRSRGGLRGGGSR